MPRTEEIAQNGRGSKNKGRGSVDNGKRLAALFSRGPVVSADWSKADAKALAGLVSAVTARGGAISFGTSRDGGAYSITLFLEQERETLWFNGDCDLDAELENTKYLIDTLG